MESRTNPGFNGMTQGFWGLLNWHCDRNMTSNIMIVVIFPWFCHDFWMIWYRDIYIYIYIYSPIGWLKNPQWLLAIVWYSTHHPGVEWSVTLQRTWPSASPAPSTRPCGRSDRPWWTRAEATMRRADHREFTRRRVVWTGFYQEKPGFKPHEILVLTCFHQHNLVF